MLYVYDASAWIIFVHFDTTNATPHVEGILPKGPYLPCVSMAGRALLAGYPRCILEHNEQYKTKKGLRWNKPINLGPFTI